MQISRSVHPEVSTEDTIQGDSQVFGEVFHDLARQRESRIEEGHNAGGSCSHAGKISEVCGKLSDRLYQGKERNSYSARISREEKELWGRAFLGSRAFVSTVGKDEKAIREYIRKQEDADRRMDQMTIFE